MPGLKASLRCFGMPPYFGTAPPDKPEPAPRGVAGSDPCLKNLLPNFFCRSFNAGCMFRNSRRLGFVQLNTQMKDKICRKLSPKQNRHPALGARTDCIDYIGTNFGKPALSIVGFETKKLQVVRMNDCNYSSRSFPIRSSFQGMNCPDHSCLACRARQATARPGSSGANNFPCSWS